MLSSPWVAVDSRTDPSTRALELKRLHARGAGSGSAPRGLRPLVADSWRRSLEAGVSPAVGGAPVGLTAKELERARALSPLLPARKAIIETLASLDADSTHVIAIADGDANLLWVCGDPAAIDGARQMRFEEGAAWGEPAAGTNAVGTAAALDHAVQIFSAEHLVEAVHPWTCSAAPIHDRTPVS